MSRRLKRDSLPTGSGTVASLKDKLDQSASNSAKSDTPSGAELKSGWLKRGGTGVLAAMYSKRFVVLHAGPVLALYEDEARTKPKGVWPMPLGTRVVPDNATDASITSEDDGKPRVLRLRAMDADGPAWWLAMQEALDVAAAAAPTAATSASASAAVPAEGATRRDDVLPLARLQPPPGRVLEHQDAERGFQVAVSPVAPEAVAPVAVAPVTRNVNALQRARALPDRARDGTPTSVRPAARPPASPPPAAVGMAAPPAEEELEPPPFMLKVESTGQLMSAELGGSREAEAAEEIAAESSDDEGGDEAGGDEAGGGEAGGGEAGGAGERVESERQVKMGHAGAGTEPDRSAGQGAPPMTNHELTTARGVGALLGSPTPPTPNCRAAISRSPDGVCAVRLYALPAPVAATSAVSSAAPESHPSGKPRLATVQRALDGHLRVSLLVVSTH